MLRTLHRGLVALSLLSAIVGLAACASSTLPDGLYAVITTPKGEFTVRLDMDKAPLTVGNFVGLAEGKLGPTPGKRFYDGLSFHRVEAGFVVQGGDPAGNGSGGPGYQFPNEIAPDLAFNAPGVLGMANAGPGTNGSQFFITLKDSSFLTGSYPAFGKVTKGMEVVEKLAIGDKMEKVTIVRSGSTARAFKVDQAAFNERVAKLNADAEKKADAAKGEAIAAIKATWPDLARGSDGIFFKITKAGSGPTPASGETVSVGYTGMFLDGKIFDQSSKHGGPIKIVVGKGQVIQGWDRTLLLMKKGEKRLVVIPPELAYGATGAGGGAIPANAFLAFEMELVDIGN